MSSDRARMNGKTARRLAVVVLAMFGFGYALVPLYDVLCEITGLGGRTGVVTAGALDGRVDTSRTVKVQFLGTVSSQLPWEFRPNVASMEVHPGQVYETTYFARNLSPAATIGQARPSVAPSAASLHFNKTECFCFVQQEFAPRRGARHAGAIRAESGSSGRYRDGDVVVHILQFRACGMIPVRESVAPPVRAARIQRTG